MQRIPELDGIRGIAILGVLGTHSAFLRGGWHGVDIFFVLSGFLITSILISEFEATGSISVGHFYYRRALRLFPALLVYVAACALWAIKTPDVFTVPPLKAITSALLYFSNWLLAFVYPPDRASLGPLTHFWSLSIEEQFYFTWPLILLAALKMRIRWRVIAAVAVTLAIASLLVRFHFRHENASIYRIYMGTDTRADGLLIGCACALIKDKVRIPHRLAFAACGVIAFFIFTNPFASTYWCWASIFAVSACTGAVLLSVNSAPDAGLHSLLSSKALVYFGQRSYSLYLWHFAFTHYLPAQLGFLPGPAAIAVTLALSMCAAELSYRFIEQPFLKFKDRRPANRAGAIQTPHFQKS